MKRYKFESNHPIATAAGFTDYDGQTYDDAPEGQPIDAWIRWAQRKLGFKLDPRPTASRMIDGVPHLFPLSRRTGVHCIRVVMVEDERRIGYMQRRGAS